MYEDNPELAQEQAGILRRKKIAEMLQAQSIQPIQTPQSGGGFVPSTNPLSVVEKIVQAYMGKKGAKDADRETKDLSTKATGLENKAVSDYMQSRKSVPEKQFTPDMMPGEESPFDGQLLETQARDRTPQEMNDANISAMTSTSPKLRVVGALQDKIDEAQRKQASDQEARKEAAKQAALDRAALVQSQRENRPEAAVTPVTIQDPKDSNKTIVIDGRSGRVFGAGPKLTQTGTLENKRQFNMQGIGSTIQAAEDLLTGKSGKDLPTGSGIGTAYDVAAGMFGGSPSGAAEAQELKSIGGALTAKMPRMEGPQSDKDTMLYREMAAAVGDSTIPRERRIAALEQVKTLWAKYEGINQEAFSDGKPAQFSDDKEARYQAWKAKQGK